MVFIKSKDAFSLMDYAKAYAEKKTGVTCAFDPSLSVFDGNTTDKDGFVIESVVGTNEIESNENVSRLVATAGVTSIMHEVMGHVRQVNREFYKNDSLSKALTLNHFACKASSEYQYGEDYSSYFHQPKEIAAQFAGIKHGYDFLAQQYDKDTANEMMCEYVNYRIEHNSEFIGFRKGKPYVDVDDILDEFQHVFEKRVYEHRPLDREAAMQEPSPYADYFKSHEQPMQQTYASLCRNGVKQDLMMTSIYLYQEDKNDRLRSMYPSLEDVPYAPSAAMTLRYYPSWIHEKDKDMRLMNLISDDVVTADKEMEFE